MAMKTVIVAVGLLAAVRADADPADFKAHMKAGYALEKQNKWSEAATEFEAAAKEAPDGRAAAELGWSALQANDLDRARKATLEALRYNPDAKLRATLLFNLGLIDAKRNEPGLARLSFEASLALKANPAAKTELAKVATATPSGGCYELAAQVLPASSSAAVRDAAGAHELASATYYCDTPARIVLASVKEGKQRRLGGNSHGFDTSLSGTAMSLDRTTSKVSSSAVTGSCHDDCGDNSHAGCSEMSGCTLRTTIAGARIFKVWTEERFIGDKDDAATAASCGPELRRGDIKCSTQHHVALVEASRTCNTDGVGLTLSLYDATKQRDFMDTQPTLTADGDRDFTAATPTYKFGKVTLALGAAGKPSTLTVDGKTEDCLGIMF
jgi:hypothetical protein